MLNCLVNVGHQFVEFGRRATIRHSIRIVFHCDCKFGYLVGKFVGDYFVAVVVTLVGLALTRGREEDSLKIIHLGRTEQWTGDLAIAFCVGAECYLIH